MTRNEVVQSPFVRDLIRNKARKMMRRGGYSPIDEEDLQQELQLLLLQAWSRFDPNQGEERAFVYTVIVRAEAFLLRRRQRQLRRDEAIWQAAVHRHCEVEDQVPTSDRRADVAAICSALPPALRDLTHRLCRSRLARVARDLNVPRSTLQRRIAKLRTPFRSLQLEESG